MESVDTVRTAYGKAVAKAWSDADYKRRLLKDPRTALSEVGLEAPADVGISVVEDATDRRHFVLPPPPAEGELGDEVVQRASGGLCCNRCCNFW